MTELDLNRGRWVVDAADRDVITRLLPSLDALAHQRADHPSSDRSPLVRDAAADPTLYAGQATGRLAWLLVGVGRALEPLLYHQPVPGVPTASTQKRLADAQHVLLRLRALLRLARAHQVAHP